MTPHFLLASLTDVGGLLTNYRQYCHALNLALQVPMVIACCAGVAIAGYRMRHSAALPLHAFLQAGLVIMLSGGLLMGLGDRLADMVDGVQAQMGLQPDGANPGHLWQLFAQAIQRKFGTDSSAGGSRAVYDAKAAQPFDYQTGAPSDSGQGATTINGTGLHLTLYGYEKPGDPDYDKNSGHGIGNHDNHLVPLESLALPDAVAQQYNLHIGDRINIALKDGRSISGVYADTTGNIPGTHTPITDVIDIYDPQKQAEGLNQAAIAGVNGMGADVPQAGIVDRVQGWLDKAAMTTIFMKWAWLVYAVSVFAGCVMWVMGIIQQMLFLGLIAISPLYLGFLMVPQLVGAGSRFLMFFASVCIWPLAWTLVDTVCSAFIDLAINPTGNFGLGLAGAAGGFALFICLGILIVVFNAGLPAAISISLVQGHGGLTHILSAAHRGGQQMVGAAANQAHRANVSAAAMNRGGGGGGGASSNGSSPAGSASRSASGGGSAPSGAAATMASRPHTVESATPQEAGSRR